MRTRTRNTIIRSVVRGSSTSPSTHVACNGTVTNDTAGHPAVPFNISAARYERISDALGKGTSHPVVHKTVAFDVNDGLTNETWPCVVGGNWGVISYAKPNAWYENSNVYIRDVLVWDVSDSGNCPPNWTMEIPGNETSIINDVLEKAAGVKADVLLNVVEANQAWPAVQSLATSLPNMARNWKDLRKVIKTASNGFLAWKFGVSPILSDTIAVINHLDKLKQDIKRHKDGDSVRTMKMIPIKMLNPRRDQYAPGMLGATVISKFEIQGRLTSTPNVRYVLVTEPQVKYLGEVFNSIDTVLRRFATSPAQLAWELVPFSFVLDWFVDLRGASRAIDEMLGFYPYKVKSFTKSMSYDCTTECYTSMFSPCNGSLVQTWKSVSVDYKYYERSVLSSRTLPTIKSRFGKNQAAISAALIAQQLTRTGR